LPYNILNETGSEIGPLHCPRSEAETEAIALSIGTGIRHWVEVA
jgi:hypothetical protein